MQLMCQNTPQVDSQTGYPRNNSGLAACLTSFPVPEEGGVGSGRRPQLANVSGLPDSYRVLRGV